MVNTKRRMVWTVDVEADDHNSGPLSDVAGFVEESILVGFRSEVSEKMWEALNQRMKTTLKRCLVGRAFSDLIEQSIIDNVSSEGWSVLDLSYEIQDGEGDE